MGIGYRAPYAATYVSFDPDDLSAAAFVQTPGPGGVTGARECRHWATRTTAAPETSLRQTRGVHTASAGDAP